MRHDTSGLAGGLLLAALVLAALLAIPTVRGDARSGHDLELLLNFGRGVVVAASLALALTTRWPSEPRPRRTAALLVVAAALAGFAAGVSVADAAAADRLDAALRAGELAPRARGSHGAGQTGSAPHAAGPGNAPRSTGAAPVR